MFGSLDKNEFIGYIVRDQIDVARGGSIIKGLGWEGAP